MTHPTRGRQKSPEKQDIILQAAMHEFLEHGYAATSMDRIATTAGVSKATVYSHFKDKTQLFESLTAQLAQDKILSLGNDSNIKLQGKPREVLTRFATTILTNNRNNKTFLDFTRLVIGESGRFPHLAHRFFEHLHLPVLNALSTYLASQPELRLRNPDVTARVILGAILHFIVMQEMMHGKTIQPIEDKVFINGLVALIKT